MMNKVRFKVKKTGYFDKNNRFIDDITFATFQTESSAIMLLEKIVQDQSSEYDAEWFGIERQLYNHIADDIYDWDTDDNYGESDSLKRLYELQLKSN